MQPAPATPAPDVSMTDSVIGGDVSTTNIYVTQNNGIQWPSFALVMAAMILCSIGMMTDAWAVQEMEEEILGVPISVEVEMGLDDITTTSCMGTNCTIVEDDLGTMSDNCTTLAEQANLTEEQSGELCGDIQDTATAGFVGIIFITLGIVVMLFSIVAALVVTKGTVLPFSQYYPFIGTAFILVGIFSWNLILPEGEATLGYSARLTISGLLASGMAGTYLTICHKFDKETKNRKPGLGARTLGKDTSAREFVVRETGSGSHTLSIIEDSVLFRLSKSIRSGEVTSTEDLFVTKIDALIGFTHTRYDWLDTTKYLWNILTLAGLILATLDGSLTYVLFFAVGLILSIMQFADPELIVFETNSGKHRLFIFRAGSNRTLTDISMDHFDSVMREMLSGNEIDTSKIDDAAQQIADNVSELKAASEAAAAAQQAAIMEAQAQAQAQAAAQAQAQMQAQAEMQAQMQAQAQAQAAAQAQAQMQAQAEMQAQQAAAIPATPAPTTPAPTTPAPKTPAPPTPPTSMPPVMNPPAAPTSNMPAPIPPPGVAAAPLPPIPPNLDPSLVAAMDMPTETIGDAPEVPMQAAPRDDALSEGEKEDILSDLGDD